jgi:anaerobic magnesium-protoporphyrin IX monomethyl ester cyclase
MWTTLYVRRDPERVVDEIERLVARYRITNVDLHDLTAMLTKEWIVDFAKAIVRRRVEITFQLPSGTRSEAIDAEAARWLYAAGCRNFCYAPESGSPTTLARIRKKVSLPRLRESLRHAIAAGLDTHASIIIGFPHEGPAELLETWRLVVQLALDGATTAAVMVFAPYPGSEEYERLRSAGAIVHDELYCYSSLLRSAGARRSIHPRWSSTDLAALQLGLLSTFYALSYARRPQRLLDVVRRVAAGTQESVMDQFLSTKLRQLGLRRSAAL